MLLHQILTYPNTLEFAAESMLYDLLGCSPDTTSEQISLHARHILNLYIPTKIPMPLFMLNVLSPCLARPKIFCRLHTFERCIIVVESMVSAVLNETSEPALTVTHFCRGCMTPIHNSFLLCGHNPDEMGQYNN